MLSIIVRVSNTEADTTELLSSPCLESALKVTNTDVAAIVLSPAAIASSVDIIGPWARIQFAFCIYARSNMFTDAKCVQMTTPIQLMPKITTKERKERTTAIATTTSRSPARTTRQQGQIMVQGWCHLMLISSPLSNHNTHLRVSATL